MSVAIKQPAMRDFFTRLFESIDQLAKNIGFLFMHFVLRGKVGMFDYDFEENEEDGLIHIRGNGIEPNRYIKFRIENRWMAGKSKLPPSAVRDIFSRIIGSGLNTTGFLFKGYWYTPYGAPTRQLGGDHTFKDYRLWNKDTAAQLSQ